MKTVLAKICLDRGNLFTFALSGYGFTLHSVFRFSEVYQMSTTIPGYFAFKTKLSSRSGSAAL